MKRSLGAVALLLLIAGTGVAETIAPSELKRGDVGWGLSVFAGSEPERFEVEVLGVLGNFRAGTDFILAKLTGHDLERSGVAAGMSGSPVYFDGRLAGAVAFGWTFTQDAVALITPIGSMRELSDGNPRPGRSAAAEIPTLQQLAALDLPDDLLAESLGALRPPDLGEAAAFPLWTVAGFEENARSFLASALQSGVAAAGSRPESELGELVAGAAVAGVLVDGDLRIAVTGTVTERRDDEILAFGHPFLGQGELRLPMATAEIVTVVASRLSSFKVSNTGRIVGAFEEDRAAGVRGRLGAEAPMVPLRVRVTTRGAGQTDSPSATEMRMQVAEVAALSPSLLATSVLGALDAADRAAGAQGLDLRATWEMAEYGSLTIDQSFDGETAALSAVNYLLAVSNFLLRNPLEAVELQAMEVDLTTHPSPRTATLVAGHADRARVRPGETVNLSLDLVAWQGEPFRSTVEVALPPELPAGTYYLLVGDGVSLDVARLSVERRQPVTFDQALTILRSFHSRRDLVALGLFADQGLAVAGEAMPRLPGSVRSIWSAAASQSALPLVLAVAQEEVSALDRPLDGAVRIDLEILRKKPLKGSEAATASGSEQETKQ